jgi:hypothetical protein
MGDTDFSTQFQAICQKATAAQEKIKNANKSQHKEKVAGKQGRVPDAAVAKSGSMPGKMRCSRGGRNSATGGRTMRRR